MTGSGAPTHVLHAATLDQVNSVRGGPYTTGPFDSHNHQWGHVDVSDDGTDIAVTFTGYRSDAGTSVQVCQETFVVTPAV